jgi:hypothetical protein
MIGLTRNARATRNREFRDYVLPEEKRRGAGVSSGYRTVGTLAGGCSGNRKKGKAAGREASRLYIIVYALMEQ